MMNWARDVYRDVLMVGTVDVGAVYPPRGGGRHWRWRAWVTRSGHAHDGRSASRDAARKEVEERFEHFLSAAQLRENGGDK